MFVNFTPQNHTGRHCQAPFEIRGIDFSKPLRYTINKKKKGKSYVHIFSRAVHLELIKSQKAGQLLISKNSKHSLVKEEDHV